MGNQSSRPPSDTIIQQRLNERDLHDMANKGDVETVQYLVHNRVNIDHLDADGNTALHVGLHHPDLVRWLIIHFANVSIRNKEGLTALRLAARNASTENVVTALLGAGGDQDLDGALHDACGNGLARIVCSLLGAGADVDARDSEGKDALWHARAHPQIVLLVNAMRS